jgi:ribosomal-protein-alanine N-acetyltransferase
MDVLLAIEQACFTAPWTRKMFEAELDGNPFGRLMIAELAEDHRGGGRPAGFICYWVVFEELRFLNLAVVPWAQRRGIAAELLRHALAAGKAAGAVRAFLEVRSSNEAARALYARHGFRQTAIRSRYYVNPVEDAVIMSLDPL